MHSAHPTTLRTATLEDVATLRALMDRSIRTLVGRFLDAAHVQASLEIMGLDTTLIEDGTYLVAEVSGVIAGCGGWSRRATLFGGDHSQARNGRLLDPATEPARIRAMYTDPAHARRGIGRRILAASEAAARAEGFRWFELVATVAGEPLYQACGYRVAERLAVRTSAGLTVPCARMTRRPDES